MTSVEPFLFRFNATALIDEVHYSIDVPYGSFMLKATTSEEEITGTTPPRSYRLQSGARVTVWQNSHGRLELFRSSVTGQLYEGAYVDGCEAAIWRYQALRDGISLTTECAWTALPGNADGGPDGGQNLTALTWDIKPGRVSLGTDDVDCLREQAIAGNLPARWASTLSADAVRHLPEGLQVTLPKLNSGENCQVTFLVAWNIPPDDEDASTWVSVQAGPQIILKSAGCR